MVNRSAVIIANFFFNLFLAGAFGYLFTNIDISRSARMGKVAKYGTVVILTLLILMNLISWSQLNDDE